MLEELDAIAWTNRGARVSFFTRLDDAAEKMAAHIHGNGNGLAMRDVQSSEFKVYFLPWNSVKVFGVRTKKLILRGAKSLKKPSAR